jgi:lysophospholipase L1-like esterase
LAGNSIATTLRNTESLKEYLKQNNFLKGATKEIELFTYSIKDREIDVVGALGFEEDSDGWITPRRLPDWTINQFADGAIERFSKFPSGVRLRFTTSADRITLKVRVSRLVITGIAEQKRPAAFDLLINGLESQTQHAENGNTLRLTATAPSVFTETLEVGEIDNLEFSGLGNASKNIEIWLPTSAIVEIAEVSASSEIAPSSADSRKRWLHYGSSISQCIEADRPMDAWALRAAQLLNLNITNFGLAGQCQLDGFVARSMAALPADVITLKLGINIVNADSMRERAFVPAVHNFLDILRESAPHTPIIIISAIWCPFHEEVPGPTMIDGATLFGKERPAELAAGALTLQRTRELLEEVVAKRSDENLHFMDGLTLFGADDEANLPDKLHPNSPGYRLMAERFAAAQRAFIQSLPASHA